MDKVLTYEDIARALPRAKIPTRELHGPGHVLVIPSAGRILAMAFTTDGPNLFWSHPELVDSDLVRHRPEQLVGSLGGDRLWFAPETDYFWAGVPDWRTFSNYRVPPEADPGNYNFVDAGTDAITLRARIHLRVRATGQIVRIKVERVVRMTPSPIQLDTPDLTQLQYVGIQTSHTVEFESTTTTGCVDLWHLLQVPVGSLLILPLRSCATSKDKVPLVYAGDSGLIERSDCFLWSYSGIAGTKIGLSSKVLTGRSGILRALAPGHACLIVRQFAVDPSATYADHPYHVTRTDQAFQLWDGLGFGEMEHHSPILDAQHGPRAVNETDFVWAFAGRPESIRTLAERILNVGLPSAGS